MLAFEDLGAGNWDKYKDLILNSENVFPESMRSAPEDFADMLEGDGIIAKVALLDSQYMGNAIGCHVPPEDRPYYEITDMPENVRIIYVLNLVINPEHQGKGYGKLLLQEFVKASQSKGYDYVIGHFRQNASLHIMRKIGAVEKGLFKNWENSSEEAVACCVNLHDLKLEPLGQERQPVGLLPPASQVQPTPLSDGSFAPAAPEMQQPETDLHFADPADPSSMAPAPHL